MKTVKQLLDFFGVEFNRIYRFKTNNKEIGYFRITENDLKEPMVCCSNSLKLIKKGKGALFNLLKLRHWDYQEYKWPILDKEEYKYLSDAVKPFKERVEYIIKRKYGDKYEFISIQIRNDVAIQYPNFNKNTMYKGMEIGIEYTLEELCL